MMSQCMCFPADCDTSVLFVKGFGVGNFKSLFEAIEKEQFERGN